MAFTRYVFINSMYIITLSYTVTIAELNTFLIKLDERYEAKVKKQGMLRAKKIRRIGCLSSSTPPHDAAKWMVDKEWGKKLVKNNIINLTVTFHNILVTLFLICILISLFNLALLIMYNYNYSNNIIFSSVYTNSISTVLLKF